MHSRASVTQPHGSTPDPECVMLLPRVCELLAASGSALPDDTSLEKMLDWFTQLTKAGISLHESFPCLLEFVSSVLQSAAADSAIVAFILKLTGLLSATDAGFQITQDRAILDEAFNIMRWQELSRWDDPSVKSGWVHGVRSMTQHPKALSFFIQSELMTHLLQLQEDPSLFVASSASQLLTHILLFYQPEPPASYEKLPAETFPNAEYRTAVTAASKYLTESLNPKGQKSVHQRVRLLRVISQILSEAFSPLRGHMFEAVCASIEDLVKAGYSQLTLPLMEVILSAQSGVSLAGADRLLCAMLELEQPTERIRAAAALLQKGFSDPVSAAKAVRIILLPLGLLTGQSLICSQTAAEAERQIQEELQNKSSFTSAVCMCVSNIHHTTQLSAEAQPCDPGLVVSTVVRVLHMCTGGSSVSPVCAETRRYIYGNSRIQKCALDALTVLSNCSDVCDRVKEVCAVLLLHLNDPDSDSMVLHKCYQALLKWTSSGTNRALVSTQLQQDLLQLVYKRVCDLRWEVRDSTVEFLGQQTAQTTSSCESPPPPLLEEHSTVPLLTEALQDQESYVRASAVHSLAQTLQRSWQQDSALSHEQSDLTAKLLTILREDTEGFSRRAVLQFFISCFSHTSSFSTPLLMTSVQAILSLGSSDLDWEVKLHTLELARLLMDWTLAGHTRPTHPYAAFSVHHTGLADALSRLVESGVVSALLSGLFDCDRPVGLKACQLLMKLRESLDVSAETVAVKCGLPSWGWGLEVAALLGSDTDLVSVCEVLRCLHLEERLGVLGQSSDHVQNSPLSLLKDILTARDVHSHLKPSDALEVIVDCY